MVACCGLRNGRDFAAVSHSSNRPTAICVKGSGLLRSKDISQAEEPAVDRAEPQAASVNGASAGWALSKQRGSCTSAIAQQQFQPGLSGQINFARKNAGQLLVLGAWGPSRSVADHPGALARKCFRAVGCCHRGFVAAAAATTAPRRVFEARVVTRALWLVAREFVDAHGASRATVHECQARRAHENTRGCSTTVGASSGFIAVAQGAKRIEATAGRAGVVVGWHGARCFKGRATEACRSSHRGA